MPGGSIGVRQDRATVRVYDMLACVASASRLLEALSRFASQVNIDTASASSIALFRGPHIDDDRQVEALPWESREVREVHAADGQPWAPDFMSGASRTARDCGVEWSLWMTGVG